MKYWICITVVLIVVGVTGCSKAQPTVNPVTATVVPPQHTAVAATPTPAVKNEADTKQTGYLTTNDNGAMFIQWTELDNRLTGQLIITYVVAKSDPIKMDNQSGSFTGIHNGNSISLIIQGGKTFTGSLDKNQLTIVFPSDDGKLESHVLKPATVDDYNKTITDIQMKIQDTNNKAAQLKANAQRLYNQQKAVTDNNQRLNDMLAALVSDTKNLASVSAYGDILKAYEDTRQTMEKDYAHLKADASLSPLTGVRLGQVQVELGTMQVDVGTFQTHNGSMEIRTSAITNGINRLKSDKTAVQAIWIALQAATANDTTGTKMQFTADDVTSAVNAAQQQIDSSNDILQTAKGKAADYYNTAQDTLAKASNFVDALKATD